MWLTYRKCRSTKPKQILQENRWVTTTPPPTQLLLPLTTLLQQSSRASTTCRTVQGISSFIDAVTKTSIWSHLYVEQGTGLLPSFLQIFHWLISHSRGRGSLYTHSLPPTSSPITLSYLIHPREIIQIAPCHQHRIFIRVQSEVHKSHLWSAHFQKVQNRITMASCKGWLWAQPRGLNLIFRIPCEEGRKEGRWRVWKLSCTVQKNVKGKPRLIKFCRRQDEWQQMLVDNNTVPPLKREGTEASDHYYVRKSH